MDVRQHPAALRFREAADRFCRLLEVRPGDPGRWAEDVLAALAEVYAAGHALPDLGLPDGTPDPADQFGVEDSEWQAIYRRVGEVLGTQAAYWSYFDPTEPPDAAQGPTAGDLGDDLADIYRDLKPGLRAWERDPEASLFDWKAALFASHWGVHAVSAMRALHPLALLRGVRAAAVPAPAPDRAGGQ